MKMYKYLAMVVVLLVVVSVGQASADLLLFDRGLPTANLNDAAGANRSNVSWADGAYSTNAPSSYWLPGDDFTLGGSGSYQVDTIRVWSTDSTGLSLWLGQAGGTIVQLSTIPVVTPVTYANGQGYQASSGNFLPIYQLDFHINQTLNAGTYQFFLDGPWKLWDSTDPSSGYVNAFLHSSNAALSGSTQQGADGQLLWLGFGVYAGQVATWDSSIGNPAMGPTGGPGWDKSSDANVQVYGAPVPIPGALWLLGSGLVGLAGLRRRSKR